MKWELGGQKERPEEVEIRAENLTTGRGFVGGTGGGLTIGLLRGSG